MSILDDTQAKAKEYLPDGKQPLLPEKRISSLQPPLPQQMQVPVVCALNLALQGTDKGISIMLYNQVPDANWNIGLPMHQIPVAVINLPITQSKDLMIMIMEIIDAYEKNFGEIVTPYMLEKGLRETSTKQ